MNQKTNTKKTLIRISFTALFAALTAGAAFFSIPIGAVPIVLQNMFAVLSGLILGPVLGGAALLLFLLAGAIGFPVFSGGTGGLVHFAGPTGGYLIGYFLAAVLAGLIAGKASYKRKPVRIIIAVISGFLVIYIPGLLRLNMLFDLNLAGLLGIGLFPFLLGDLLKAAAAILIAPRLRRIASDFLD